MLPVMFQTMPVARSMPRSRSGEEMAAAAASRAVLAGGTTDTHQRRARVRHHRADIGEIDVDEAGKGNDVADAADALAEDVVGEEEGVLHGSAVSTAERTIVGNDDQGIDVAAEALDGVHRLVCSWRPSNLKGMVAMPTVRIPAALATPATTGAAPEPVPPPIPAVTNTMSEPASDCSMDCLLSSAAFWPISGLPPAPRPRVSSLPIWMWQDEGTRRGGHGLRKSGDGCCRWVSIFFFELGKRGDMRRARAAERFTRLARLSSGISKTHLSVGVYDPELHSVDVAPNHAVHGVGTTTTDTDDLMNG